MMKVARCSSCGASIIWTLSPAGRRMPVNARPVTVYALLPGGEEEEPIETVKSEGFVRGLQCRQYISHFATCPNASAHSRAGLVSG